MCFCCGYWISVQPRIKKKCDRQFRKRRLLHIESTTTTKSISISAIYQIGIAYAYIAWATLSPSSNFPLFRSFAVFSRVVLLNLFLFLFFFSLFRIAHTAQNTERNSWTNCLADSIENDRSIATTTATTKPYFRLFRIRYTIIDYQHYLLELNYINTTNVSLCLNSWNLFVLDINTKQRG